MACVSILGAGAMGCLWAAHLHQAFLSKPEHAIQFLSTRADAPGKLEFSLSSPFLSDQQSRFKLELAVRFPHELTPATKTQPHIILLCTKSYHAFAAVQKLKPFLNEHTYLVLFQNGLGSQHRILDAFPGIPIFAAVSTEGVNRQAKGHLVHAGKGLTRIGSLNEAARETHGLEHCLSVLRQPGITLQPETNIWPALWEKLAINCAINPFTAILNCPNGEIKDRSLFKKNWPELKRELNTMLELAGVKRSNDELEAYVLQVIEKTRTNISSMLQDVRAERKTEIEDINGFAARFLAEKKLNHRINNALYKQVIELEKGYL